MSQLGAILQESLHGGRETRKILALLREKMDGVDRIRRRKSIKERLGLKNMNCCGAALGFRANTVNLSDSEDEEEQRQQEPVPEPEINAAPDRSENVSGRSCVGRAPLSPGGMNLAAALAAERRLRSADGSNAVSPNGGNAGPMLEAPGTPLRVSLMRLLAETDGRAEEERAGEVGNDTLCCVCMGRKKGAAFIPCGHTFCRVCSREMWLNRGSCPLCSRSILEILDIF